MDSVIHACFKVQDPAELNLQRSLIDVTEAQGRETICSLLHNQLRGDSGIGIQIPKYNSLFIMPWTIIPLQMLTTLLGIGKCIVCIVSGFEVLYPRAFSALP